VTTLDQVAEQTLAKCEETFPIITKPPSEVSQIHKFIFAMKLKN
jgi:hypothetical protein